MTHCCGHIVAHDVSDVSWAAQTGKHLLRTQNVSEQNQKHFCVRNKCCSRGQTGKHLCRQQCVRNNVSLFARAFRSCADAIVHSAYKSFPFDIHICSYNCVILASLTKFSTWESPSWVLWSRSCFPLWVLHLLFRLLLLSFP